MDTYKRIFNLCRPYTKYVIGALICLTMGIATRLVMPLFTRVIVDDVIGAGQLHLLAVTIVSILLLTVVNSACLFLRARWFEHISQHVVFDIRTGLYRHMQTLSYSFYDANRIGEIMSRMTGDIEGIRNLLAGGVRMILENIAYFVGALIFLFVLNAKLALVMIAVAPLVAITAFQLSKHIRKAFADVREQNAVLNTRAQESIAGIRVIKSYARESYEEDRFQEDNHKQRDLNIRISYIWSKYSPVLEFLSGIVQPLLICVGGYMVFRGNLTVGTLIAFTGYIWMINGPMRMLSNMINQLTQAATSAEKIFYYMDLGPAIRDAEVTQIPEEFKGHIRYTDVSFGYGDQRVLNNIHLDIPPGKTLAIMGATGSGKTSVVQLLGRFYECQTGKVTIDGIDVKDYPLAYLRSKMTFVTQEPFLFSDTVADNIAFGQPDAPFEDIQKAAEAAQAHSFISEMPSGYESIIGERGMGLSGGQKQRVAIARAMLPMPNILVFDDATSAVDMETEAEIQKHMDTHLKGRTRILIAHRISSVQNADEIVLLENGSIVERGTHKELVEMKGQYHQIYMDQCQDLIEATTAEGQV